MEATFKAFKGGKSKANKGLSRFLAGRELPAGFEVTQNAEGEWGFDTAALEMALDVKPVEPDGELDLQQNPDAPEHQLDAPEGESQEEENFAPVASGNMFGGIAATLGSVATTPAAAASANRAASRSSYTIEKERPEQNGIKRPSAGGLCRAVWDAMDHIRESTGQVPTTKEVRDLTAKNNWNASNAMIEFYQWRKFNGITGRAKKVEAPAPLNNSLEAVEAAKQPQGEPALV